MVIYYHVVTLNNLRPCPATSPNKANKVYIAWRSSWIQPPTVWPKTRFSCLLSQNVTEKKEMYKCWVRDSNNRSCDLYVNKIDWHLLTISATTDFVSNCERKGVKYEQIQLVEIGGIIEKSRCKYPILGKCRSFNTRNTLIISLVKSLSYIVGD